MSNIAADSTTNSKTKRKSKKSKSTKKNSKDLENQENSSAQLNNLKNQLKPIKCPHCPRTFQYECHLKYHSVIHLPGRENENGKSRKKRSGGSKKSKSKKAKAEVHPPEKITDQDKSLQNQDSSILIQVVSCDKILIYDVSNIKISGPIPIEKPMINRSPDASAPSLASSSPVQNEFDVNVAAPAKNTLEAEAEIALSPAHTENILDTPRPELPTCQTTDFSKVTKIEHNPEDPMVPDAILYQLQLSGIGDLLDSAEASPESYHLQIVETPPKVASPSNPANCSDCAKLGMTCCFLNLVPSPSTRLFVENEELPVNGSSCIDSEISNLTDQGATTESSLPEMVPQISSGYVYSAAVTAGDDVRPSSASTGYFSDFEDVPNDFHEVLSTIALQGTFNG